MQVLCGLQGIFLLFNCQTPDLKEGYNGHLTTAQAGSVGGEMVRKMIRRQEEEMSR